MKKLLLLLLCCSLPALAQKRFLVSPYGDAIPIGKNQGAAEIMKQRMAAAAVASPQVCTNKATFGYSIDDFPTPETNHIGFHKDVMAMWFVAPASGTIDTVFWRAAGVGSQDSTVTIRLFESNIYPGSGPGYGGYPSPAQTNCWGYFVNTNDLDNGVAAFIEERTDTTWYSTVAGPTPSFNPMGTEIWGSGGFPVIEEANAVNFCDLGVLGQPAVSTGDPFFITVRIYGDHQDQSTEPSTGFLATNEANPLSTHNWKFYEHVATIQPGFTCVGWVARGGFNILFWYVMTVTTNIPPNIENATDHGNTLSKAPRPVQAQIVDCDPGDSTAAGVESAWVRYSLNDVAQADLPMTYLGADLWEATLPGGEVNDVISYKVVASDSADFIDSTAATTYKVVALLNEWYAADTGAACTVHDISATGAPIDTSAFFVPLWTGAGTAPGDDGTAGPFDMGANIMLFADTFRYAWVGVNGALALSKDPLDTLDVNSNGFANTFWDFPYPQKSGRLDTAGANNMPGMIIAPFWADHILGDTAATYGRVLYGDDSDPCLFIVQWDSIGAFDDAGAIPDITTFRAVLNRCEYSVEFQYESVGTTGLDSLSLVGMQADSNEVSGPVPGWVYVNRFLYPVETKPRDSWCVKISPHVGTTAIDGWNLVAVSLTPTDGDYSKSSLFPMATSPAFAYGSGYQVADSLAGGKGYWLKFDGAGVVGGSAALFESCMVAQVQNGWNLLGGPSWSVPVGNIVAGGGTTVTSSYFAYGGAGYYTATEIEPGMGYWVKVSGDGTLSMCAPGESVPKASATPADPSPNRLTLRDAGGRSQHLWLADGSTLREAPGFFELPPLPPSGAFDVRFGSGRMLESWPDGDAASAEFPVLMQGISWPVTLNWEIADPPRGALALSLVAGGGKTLQSMAGAGSLVLRDPASAAGLAVRLGAGGSEVPKVFALGRNYPNPFNPETRLRVDIPAESDVTVAVYDLLGRLITTLMTGNQPAGSVTLTWDGRDEAGMGVPTGMYVVRMNAGEFSAVQKLLLMK